MKASRDRIQRLPGVVLVVLALSMSAAGSAAAQESASAPLYVGIGADFGFEDFSDVPSGVDIDDAYGLDAWAGYRFSDLVAVEVELEYLDGFDFSFLGADFDGRALTTMASAKIYPFRRVLPGRVEPFLASGIGMAWFEYDSGHGNADDSDFAARVGGGVDLYVTEDVALHAASSYVMPTGDLEDFAYVSLVVGVQYRFGAPPDS